MKQAVTETRAIIAAGCVRRGWHLAEVALTAGMSVKTLCKKCREPDLFTGRELNRLRDAKLITPDGYNTILAEAQGWKA